MVGHPEVGRCGASAAGSDERRHGLKVGCEQPPRAWMIGRMIAPVARMMLPLSGGPFKKIRFSMIANNLPESLVFDYINFLRERGDIAADVSLRLTT